MKILHKISAEKDDLKKMKRTRSFLLVISLVLICVFGLCALEFFPCFVTLPINLPKDDYGPGDWDSISFSVVNQGSGRIFTWRKYGYIGYVNVNKFDQLKLIKSYFNNEITKRGWIVGDNTNICDDYLPEASLLIERQDGFMLQFQEKGHPVYDNGGYFGDLICVSILGVDITNIKPLQVYDITVLAARQSPLKIILDYIGSL